MTELIDNSISEWLYAIGKDGPGKTWWDADLENRAPIYRALRINPEDHGAAYAIAPFRLTRIEGKWLILAAYPAPAIFDPALDWLGIDTVIAWEPNADRAYLLSDPQAQMVGSLSDQANTVFASPRAFFQSWAVRRAIFLTRLQTTSGKDWHIDVREADEVPGALVIGDLRKARLRPSELPEHIECQGIDPKDLNRVIMRSARLPRVTNAPSNIQRAA